MPTQQSTITMYHPVFFKTGKRHWKNSVNICQSWEKLMSTSAVFAGIKIIKSNARATYSPVWKTLANDFMHSRHLSNFIRAAPPKLQDPFFCHDGRRASETTVQPTATGC